MSKRTFYISSSHIILLIGIKIKTNRGISYIYMHIYMNTQSRHISYILDTFGKKIREDIKYTKRTKSYTYNII